MKNRSVVCDIMRIEATGVERLEACRFEMEALLLETEETAGLESEAEKLRLDEIHRCKIEDAVKEQARLLAATRAGLDSADQGPVAERSDAISQYILRMVYGEP